MDLQQVSRTLASVILCDTRDCLDLLRRGHSDELAVYRGKLRWSVASSRTLSGGGSKKLKCDKRLVEKEAAVLGGEGENCSGSTEPSLRNPQFLIRNFRTTVRRLFYIPSYLIVYYLFSKGWISLFFLGDLIERPARSTCQRGARGIGFDRSALKAETVCLIEALFTWARCAHM